MIPARHRKSLSKHGYCSKADIVLFLQEMDRLTEDSGAADEDSFSSKRTPLIMTSKK